MVNGSGDVVGKPMRQCVADAIVGTWHVENQWEGVDIANPHDVDEVIRVVPMDDTEGVRVMKLSTSGVLVHKTEFSEGVPPALVAQFIRGLATRKP
jgi:hypothetical protein